jgi:hypothetical protein
MATLQQLLQAMTFEEALTLVLAYYQKQGFPTSSWQDFGTDLTRAQAIATAIEDVVANQIPAIAGGSLLDYAPSYPGWTALTAKQIFNLEQEGATSTVGSVLFTNASGSAYTFSTSNPIIIAFAASGKRYRSTGGGVIPASGSLTVSMQAENPGASYVDPSNSGDISVVTPSMPGVTVTNPSTTYTTPTQTGSGTGTLSLGGSPSGPHSVVLNITATSAGNPPTVSYSLDGQPAVSLGSVSSVTNLAGTGINITFVVGASGVSWVSGDTYAFTTPASWITSQGADTQTDLSLTDDCRNRWSSLAEAPTEGLYKLLAKRTPTIGAQVTQCFVAPDSVINNKINVVVAGPGGVLPAPTIALIQVWLTPWARGCDIPVVQSPATTPLTIAAIVTCVASQLAAVQAAVTTALNNYIAKIAVNGTIKLSAIEALLVPNPITGQGGVAGVTDLAGLTINGAAANLVLGSATSFVLPAYPPTLNLSYIGQ